MVLFKSSEENQNKDNSELLPKQCQNKFSVVSEANHDSDFVLAKATHQVAFMLFDQYSAKNIIIKSEQNRFSLNSSWLQ